MAGNQLVAEIAAVATRLGWEPPPAIDHVEYVKRAARGMWTLYAALAAYSPWLAHAYLQEAEDLMPLDKATAAKIDLVVQGLTGDIWRLAHIAPARWAAEVAVLAVGRRRTGRAQMLLKSCRRIQAAIERHETPDTHRAYASAHPTRLPDVGRARGLFLLSREAEIWREEESVCLWGSVLGSEGSRVRGRPTSGIGDARKGDDGGWSE